MVRLPLNDTTARLVRSVPYRILQERARQRAPARFVLLGGTPGRVRSSRAFTLSGTSGRNNQILVIGATPWVQFPARNDVHYAQVIGLVLWLDPNAVRNNFGLNVSNQRFTNQGATQGLVPVLVATRINIGQGWIDLTQRMGVTEGFGAGAGGR